MLGLSRKQIIHEIINTQGSVIVSKLAEKFDVTEETVRKDLKQLEDEGILKRIYGGAVRVNANSEVDVNVREKLLIQDKELIGDACAAFINAYDSVFFDGSSTTYYVAKAVVDKPLTVTTNSLMIANLFAGSSKVKLIVIGGSFDSSRRIFLGKTTELCMQRYRFDKAFISCECLHINHGITDSNESHALIRRLGIDQSKSTYLAVDHTKFNRTSISFIAELERIHTLVTNKPLSETWVSALKQQKIKYVIAENSSLDECEFEPLP